MTDLTPQMPNRPESVPFWRDIRVLGVFAQIAFLIVVLSALGWVASNVADNLGTLGANQFLCRDGTSNFRCAFDFLRLDAQFDISETPIEYDPSDSYGRALLVGTLNTLKVAFLGIVLATILGSLAGIARLSSNWLIRTTARWYVDIIRNTPLLLQLFFLFFAVILAFPPIREAIQPFGLPVYFSQRGINLPWMVFMPSFNTWLIFIGLGIALGVMVWSWLGRRERETEHDANRFFWSLIAVLAVVVPGWFVASALAADNQGFLAPESAGFTTLADLEEATRAELGLDDLGEIDAALASGALTEEQLEAATVVLCAVEGDRAETNLTAELRRAHIPYDVNRARNLAGASADYTNGECGLFTAAQPVLMEYQAGSAGGVPSVLVPVREVPSKV